MQPTSLGANRTGASFVPASLQAMEAAVENLSPRTGIDMSAMEAQKLLYIEEAEAVGTVPPPAGVKGVVKSGIAKLKGGHPVLLFDKIGERLAFERTGVRLYDALLLKCRALGEAGATGLPPAISGTGAQLTESPIETLTRIRGEELLHFNMLSEAMRTLGGDPTAMTPCADVTAVASSGFMQVLNDPRTTLAQCLNAMLSVELTDNAGWELLAALADDAGEGDLAGQFLAALAQEHEHLAIVKGWLTTLTLDVTAPDAV